MRSYKVLGFTIRIRCGSKYESIKGVKKLRLEVYNKMCQHSLLFSFFSSDFLKL